MFIKPRKGLLIRNPATKALLTKEGCEVPETLFWLRRLKCGDVQIAKLANLLKQSGNKIS